MRYPCVVFPSLTVPRGGAHEQIVNALLSTFISLEHFVSLDLLMSELWQNTQ
jgi:hypothetical protein